MNNVSRNNALALIAGRGDLPHKIIDTQKDVRPLVVVAFEGQTPTDLPERLSVDIPVLWVKLGVIGPVLDFFKQWHVTDVTMAGGLTRPKLRDLSMDWVGARWLKVLGLNAVKGDNHLLGGIVALLEAEGYQVIPPHELVGNLFASAGVLTARAPTDADQRDIEHGVSLLNVLSPFDVGQGVVVHDGCVLGIETIEGTAALLGHVKALGRARGGVFVKMRKVGQSQQVDMPTIGVDTITQVRDAGLSGVAIEADGVQVLDLVDVIRLADEAGLFVAAL
ncbi:MAG: UDP-2,3-diacylglucosamine diphosphatase LpxI [Pseudomonadota bacterium]